MIERNYFCNLCRNRLRDTSDAEDSLRHPGIGIKWQHSTSGKDIAETRLIESEHHICLDCLKNLRKITTNA